MAPHSSIHAWKIPWTEVHDIVQETGIKTIPKKKKCKKAKWLSQRGVVFMREGVEIPAADLNNYKKTGGVFFGSDMANTGDNFDESNIFARYITSRTYDIDSVGYLFPQQNGDYHVVRKVIARNANGLAMVDDSGKISFGDLASGGTDGIDGQAIILQKLDLVRSWMKTYFNIDIDAMRYEIQSRQYVRNADGTFVKDAQGRYVNALTQEQEDGSPVMWSLLWEVLRFSLLK